MIKKKRIAIGSENVENVWIENKKGNERFLDILFGDVMHVTVLSDSFHTKLQSKNTRMVEKTYFHKEKKSAQNTC